MSFSLYCLAWGVFDFFLNGENSKDKQGRRKITVEILRDKLRVKYLEKKNEKNILEKQKFLKAIVGPSPTVFVLIITHFSYKYALRTLLKFELSDDLFLDYDSMSNLFGIIKMLRWICVRLYKITTDSNFRLTTFNKQGRFFLRKDNRT